MVYFIKTLCWRAAGVSRLLCFDHCRFSGLTPTARLNNPYYETQPEEYLVDGGFSTLEDIERLESSQTKVYAPVKNEEQKRQKGDDPFARRKGDSDEVAAWRERMGTASAKEIDKQRSATAEFPNAGCRNRSLMQFVVRGLTKTKVVSVWHALAHNFQRTLSLHAAAGLQLV